MTPGNDPRLELELRDALERRSPGPAPRALRERVLRVPDAAPPRGAGRQALTGLLGLAAAVGVSLVVLGLVGRFGFGSAGSPTAPATLEAPAAGSPVPPTASTPAASGTTAETVTAPPPEPTPFATASPTPYSPRPGETPLQLSRLDGAGPGFDATRDGVGVQARVDDGTGERVAIGILVGLLAGLAFVLRGWKRIVPAGGAAALAVWILAASLAPVALTTNGGGSGQYTAWARKPVGYSEEVLYELAAPHQPFVFDVIGVHGESLLPVRLEAVEAPSWNDERWVAPRYTAAWLDREDSGGGSSGPTTPLTGIEISGFRTIWIVGRSGACSIGPTFYPNEDRGATGLANALTVEISVLGIPRRVELPLQFSIVEPNAGSCPG